MDWRLLLAGMAALPAPAQAEQFFATQVISASPGAVQGGQYADPARALGAPTGGGLLIGSIDVYSLGIGGSLTLGFDDGSSQRFIQDLPGADFIVSENAIYADGDEHASFAELAFVEVSSNGADFARFSVLSLTPSPVSAYGTIDSAAVTGFAGAHAVLASAANSVPSPFDPAAAGGDAFDLAALLDHPLVRSGKVDLSRIRFVRLTDVLGDGSQKDSQDRPIYDPTGLGTNGADIDSVAVIHGAGPRNQWKGPGGGSYQSPQNWTQGTPPGGAGSEALFGPGISSDAQVSLDQDITLAAVRFDSAHRYILAGPGRLNLASEAGAQLQLLSGSHTMLAPLAFETDTLVDTGSGLLTLAGGIDWADGVVVTILAGHVEFAPISGTTAVGSDVTLLIEPGATVDVRGPLDPFSGSGHSVNIINRGTLNFLGGTIDLGSIELGGAGAAAGAVPEPQLACLLPLALLVRRRRRRAPAFTLVELLVVTGVIAMLVGLLLPALGKARHAAQRVACASNLRQVAIAAIEYAHDNHGSFPPAHLDFLASNLHRWHGVRASLTAPFDFRLSPLRPYLHAPAIKACPSWEPTKAGFEAAAGGYGYNNHFIGSSTEDTNWAPGSENTPARTTMIRRPAEKLLFADAAMAGRGGVLMEYSFIEPPETTWGPSSPSIHFRHDGRANIAWADAHVTAEPMDWTYPTNVYGANNAAAHLGWFGPKDNRLFTRD